MQQRPFWLNLLFVGVAAALVVLSRRHVRRHGQMAHDMEGDGPLKRVAAGLAAALVAGGMLALTVRTL